MNQTFSTFWQSIKQFSFENFLNRDFYFSSADISNHWQVLFLICILILIISILVKMILKNKLQNNLISSKLIGKIYWWLTSAGILYILLIAFTYYKIEFLGYRIFGLIITLVLIVWMILVLKWIIKDFPGEYIENLKNVRINKYLKK